MNAPMYLLLFCFTIIRSCIISRQNQKTKPNKNHLDNNALLTDSSIQVFEPINPKKTQHQQIDSKIHDQHPIDIEDNAANNLSSIQPTETSPALSSSKSNSASYNSTENVEVNIEELKQEISMSASPYLRRLLCKTKDIPQIYYIIAALADVEGNVLLLTAYEYTTITSVSLLDCFAIPMVMIWGIFIFGRRYKLQHFIGITVSLLGMILMVYTDSIVNKSANHGSNPVFGDILVLCGATCYSISNSFAEYVVKHYQSIWQYLRMIGLYGFIITLIQGFIWEYHALFYVNEYSWITLLFLMGYVLSLSVYYIAIPIMLKYSSAVVMNLSLLSADFWAVLAAVFLFSVTLNYLYFIAFVTIIGGVAWYNVANHMYKMNN